AASAQAACRRAARRRGAGGGSGRRSAARGGRGLRSGESAPRSAGGRTAPRDVRVGAARGREGLGHRRGGVLGYALAAYAVVLGSLVAYGLWIQAQRRALRRRDPERRDAPPGAR